MQTNLSFNDRSSWGVIFLSILAGIAAGFQIGMVPPAISSIQESLGSDLISIGWIISAINLMGVFLGIFVGVITDRFGSRYLTLFGIVILLVASIAGSYAESSSHLILARVLSGLGLVSIAIAVPRFIIVASKIDDRSLTLGLWGIYMPAGMALGMVVSPIVLEYTDWRGLWRINAIMLLIFLFVFLYGTRDFASKQLPKEAQDNTKALAKVITLLAPWLLGALFALYAIQYFAVMNWLPVFMEKSLAYPAKMAALASALVVSFNAIGNILAAWLLHRGAERWILQLTSLVIMPICGVAIYTELVNDSWKFPMVILFSFIAGLLPATILAAAAVHSPKPRYMATVNGIIVQCTYVGSLSGPPLMAMIISNTGGWSDTWKLLFVCSLLGVFCIAGIRAIEKRIIHP